MSRSNWKGPFSIVLQTIKEKEKIVQQKKIWSRASMILPVHLGGQVKIYNGKSWISVRILEEMVGHKFGEFASTRKKTIHKSKKIQQKSRRK